MILVNTEGWVYTDEANHAHSAKSLDMVLVPADLKYLYSTH